MNQGRRLESEKTTRYKADHQSIAHSKRSTGTVQSECEGPGSGDAPSWKRELC
jgi:hypothetical protein